MSRNPTKESRRRDQGRSGRDRHEDEVESADDPKETTEVCRADDKGHIVVKAEQADHTGDTHEYEFESTSYDDIKVKTEDAERREARKPNDIVVKAKDAEHREARKPMEKSEEAEHTGTLMSMSTSLPVMMILR